MSLFSTPGREARCRNITLTRPLFISDLHLSEADPHCVQVFLDFMRQVASQYQQLVILGDLFDYWVGDDAADTVAPIMAALRHFSQDGKQLYIMQGNRDFLLGQDFARQVNATLLADPCVAQYAQHAILLSHGDLWCTNDEKYQAVRKRVRSFFWQWSVLRLPLKKRLAIATQAREKSRQTKKYTDPSAMQVVDSAVIADAHKARADWIIHGHTHNPCVTSMPDGITRWVLPDWKFNGEFSHVGYLCLNKDRPEFKDFL